jgi:septum formation protein
LVARFDVRPADIDETLAPGAAATAVRDLALAKARVVAAAAPEAVVVGADTVVTIDGEIFGKPSGPDAARAMLRRLRGQWHDVITGVAVVDRSRETATAVVSQVLIGGVDDARIDAYVASGEPLDKAGAYAIQALGGALVVGLVGSYTNVIGLPLEATRRLLESFGVPVTRGFGR